MEMELNVLLLLTGIVSATATLLGFLSERTILGATMLGGFTLCACGLCCFGMWVGGWVGLSVGVFLVTCLAYYIGKAFGKQRGSLFVPALWLGFCASCAIGYRAGGEIGLLTITLPSLVVFWGAIFKVSRYLLPLRDRSQWGEAFRTLVAYGLGTNRPYHVLEGRRLVQRVPGNPYGQFFAGPGIVLTGPAHAPVIWDGLRFRRIGEPGLTFTGRFETIYQVVDLRPQLRSFHVEAITKDGIRIRVLTFIPFRLHARGEEPQQGSSFPLDEDSVYRAVWKQPVRQGQRLAWQEVVPMVTTRLLRKIVGQYKCDDLCEPFRPSRDPRVEIRTKLVRQLRKELQDWGIEIIGASISDLVPVDSTVVDNRVEAWRAEWNRKIATILGEGRASAILEVERAHARAQADMISAIRDVVEQHQGVDPSIVADMACLRFIESLEEMTLSPQIQEALPVESVETLAYLRHAVDGNRA
jgi:regulator of protease activity HflC (stomatin/prohibitin superfamily)